MTTAYDTEGYIDYFTVRGFVVDNRFNFRRDGLPINAETSIPLENKARVDILKGLSGLQAGTSAPGGLVDLVVKRPLDAPLRSAFVEWRERGSVLGSVDISQRFGADDAFGVRLNAGAEHIDPIVRNAKGNRNVLALAGDWRASAATLIEAEIENSHRSQPSVPGFSLLGDAVPGVPDPHLNLNNQPWSLPVVFDATTGSLRITQKLGEGWRLVAHGLMQRLRTDDRIAFPFGCSDPNPPPDGTYYPDRFCPNGNFDLYDFRSENESRRSSTLDVTLHGAARTASLAHEFSLGVQRTIVKNRFQASAFNFAGTGNVDGTLVTPPAPDLVVPQTNRDERSTEIALRDAIAFGSSGTTAWLGARHTQLDRSATPTDGSPGTAFKQSFTTPFVALSHAARPRPARLRELGQGRRERRGAERAARPQCRAAGAALPQRRPGAAGGREPAGRGRHQGRRRERRVERRRRSTSAARSSATSRRAANAATCSARAASSATSATRASKAAWRGAAAPGACARGAQWLHARVEVPSDPTLDGKKPTNVPAVTARLQGDWQVPAIAGGGLRLLAAGTYESAREVLPDNSVQIPSVTKFDLGARYETKSSAGTDLDAARRHRQRLRPARLAREPLPVQPRLPVPARAADAARLAAGRPLSRRRREGRRL